MMSRLVRKVLVLTAATLLAAGGLSDSPLSPTPLASGEGTLLWSAGHEEGTLGEWLASYGGEIYSIGTGRASITPGFAHTGQYSVQMSISNATGVEQGIQLHRWAEPETHPEAYYSAWLYFPETYSGMSWWNIFQWRSKVSSSKAIPFWILNVGNRADGSMYFYLYDWISRKGYEQSSANIAVGRWTHLEANYRQATDNQGQITIWQDGTEILSVSSVTTKRTDEEIQWAINNYTDNIAPSHATVYVDDAAMSLVRLGPNDAADRVAASRNSLAAALPGSSRGSEYFVDSANGSDSNPGTTPAAPWKTLSKVSAAPLAPGDIVSFKRGGSWKGTLSISSSGNESKPITVQAYGEGPNPEIQNTRANNSRTVILYGNHIVLKEFTLHDAHEAGVEVRGNHNTVRDNEIYAAGWGVRLLGQSGRVVDNYIHDLLMIVDDDAFDNDYGAAGVVIWGGANGSEIAGNRFLRCRAPSHDYGHDGGVVEFWETSRDHNIHHNYSSANNGVFEIGGGTVSNVSIRDNVFFNDFDGYTGIHWGGTYAAAVEGFTIEHNTIVQQGGGSTIFGHWDGVAPDANRVTVRNNIIATNHAVYSDRKFTHSDNVYYLMTHGSLGPDVSLGQGDRIVDPMFMNLAAGDLQLRDESPAIGAGPDLGFTMAAVGVPVLVAETKSVERNEELRED